MKKGVYYITEEQLETFRHCIRMFEVNADNIKDITNNEKPDILYGFELGKMYSHLRECFNNMCELEDDIKNQEFENKKGV